MSTVPHYKKWFADSAIATSNSLRNLYPGQILASGTANHSKNPPTNRESYQFDETF